MSKVSLQTAFIFLRDCLMGGDAIDSGKKEYDEDYNIQFTRGKQPAQYLYDRDKPIYKQTSPLVFVELEEIFGTNVFAFYGHKDKPTERDLDNPMRELHGGLFSKVLRHFLREGITIQWMFHPDIVFSRKKKYFEICTNIQRYNELASNLVYLGVEPYILHQLSQYVRKHIGKYEVLHDQTNSAYNIGFLIEEKKNESKFDNAVDIEMGYEQKRRDLNAKLSQLELLKLLELRNVNQQIELDRLEMLLAESANTICQTDINERETYERHIARQIDIEKRRKKMKEEMEITQRSAKDIRKAMADEFNNEHKVKSEVSKDVKESVLDPDKKERDKMAYALRSVVRGTSAVVGTTLTEPEGKKDAI